MMMMMIYKLVVISRNVSKHTHTHTHTHTQLNSLGIRFTFIGLVGIVFANGLGEQDSIPGRLIPKTLKMVLDTSLLNTKQYKVRIKSKVEQSTEWSSTLPYTSV